MDHSKIIGALLEERNAVNGLIEAKEKEERELKAQRSKINNSLKNFGYVEPVAPTTEPTE